MGSVAPAESCMVEVISTPLTLLQCATNTAIEDYKVTNYLADKMTL